MVKYTKELDELFVSLYFATRIEELFNGFDTEDFPQELQSEFHMLKTHAILFVRLAEKHKQKVVSYEET